MCGQGTPAHCRTTTGFSTQASVWGSGVAGVACALLAMLTGNYSLWQVGLGNAALCGVQTQRMEWIGKSLARVVGHSTALLRQEHCADSTALQSITAVLAQQD